MAAKTICKKICKECPFSNKSLPGWLADYTVQDFKDFQNADALFPCHMTMPDKDMTLDQVGEEIKNGGLRLCRGYTESLIKSCKRPKDKFLATAVEQVRKEGVSEESMAMWDFEKHHSSFKAVKESVDIKAKKEAAIVALEKEKGKLPEFNFFGNNNHEAIDAAIEAIENDWNEDQAYDKYDTEEDNHTLDWVLQAVQWNKGKITIEQLLGHE